jgi:calcineurin-like phosphoesterase family protein
MSKVFVISDTHFNHANIIKFENVFRPFKSIQEHDEELVRRWNETVGPKDTVWHLGDVFFGREGHKILGMLNGNKKLVLGNHDHYPLAVYQQYFTKIFGAADYKNCILTHVPVHESQFPRYRKNIHGHMHAKQVMKAGFAMVDLPDERYVCVSAEHTGLAPVLMESVLG